MGMNKQEVLERAIQKAIDGGWDMFGRKPKEWEVRAGYFYDVCGVDESREPYLLQTPNEMSWRYTQIIFNPDFAKALWGKNVRLVRKCKKCGFPDPLSMDNVRQEDAIFCPYDGSKLSSVEEYVGAQPWARRLQQMVIADDPIKYLEEHM